MSVEDLLNWGELSRMLSGSRQTVRKNKKPKKMEYNLNTIENLKKFYGCDGQEFVERLNEAEENGDIEYDIKRANAPKKHCITCEYVDVMYLESPCRECCTQMPPYKNYVPKIKTK